MLYDISQWISHDMVDFYQLPSCIRNAICFDDIHTTPPKYRWDIIYRQTTHTWHILKKLLQVILVILCFMRREVLNIPIKAEHWIDSDAVSCQTDHSLDWQFDIACVYVWVHLIPLKLRKTIAKGILQSLFPMVWFHHYCAFLFALLEKSACMEKLLNKNDFKNSMRTFNNLHILTSPKKINLKEINSVRFLFANILIKLVKTNSFASIDHWSPFRSHKCAFYEPLFLTIVSSSVKTRTLLWSVCNLLVETCCVDI